MREVTTATREEVVAFLSAKRADAEKSAAIRRDSAETWRSGTDADWREGDRLAAKMSGRPVPRMSADERRETARREDAIAARYDHEAQMYAALEHRLAEAEKERDALGMSLRWTLAELLDTGRRGATAPGHVDPLGCWCCACHPPDNGAAHWSWCESRRQIVAEASVLRDRFLSTPSPADGEDSKTREKE